MMLISDSKKNASKLKEEQRQQHGIHHIAIFLSLRLTGWIIERLHPTEQEQNRQYAAQFPCDSLF